MEIRQWLADKRTRLFLLGIGLCGLIYLTAWVFPLKDNADATFVGHVTYDYASDRVAMVGDVNGDGYDDMLMGAYNACLDGLCSGGVYLILGRAAADWGAAFDVAGADASFRGEQHWSNAGRDIAGAGDVNGDGYADFLIGAYGYDASDIVTDTGKVYLVLGRREANWGRSFDLANADASFLGEVAYDTAGYALAGVGDVNGDGYDDFLVGAYSNDQNGSSAGKGYLFLGRRAADWGQNLSLSEADASFVGERASDYASYAIAGAGDVNGDGYDDFLIAAWGSDDVKYGAGKTYLILGRANPNWGQSFDLADANASFLGEALYDYAGRAVSGAGDVNRDGLADFLIAASYSDGAGYESGEVYLVFGRHAADWGAGFNLSRADASFRGEHAVDYAGNAVAGAGDTNRDGYDDFLIGAYQFEPTSTLTDTGRAYLVLGKPTGWHMDTNLAEAETASDIMAFDGEALGDQAGIDVAGGDDVNGDGFSDFLVGASYNDEHGTSAGKAYLMLGKGLAIKKTAFPTVVAPGGYITYTLHYSNTTTQEVQGVRIGDNLPAHTTFAGCPGGITCTVQGGRVFWNLGNVPSGGAGVVRLRVQVRPETPAGTVITNTAWITAPSRVNPVTSATTSTRVTETRKTLFVPLALNGYPPEVELAYDSGSGTEDASWTAGKGFAVRFTPPKVPSTLVRARFYFYGPFAPVQVRVWDANHNALSLPVTASPTQDGWLEVDLSTQNITVAGDFYVGYLHLTDYTPTLGSDFSAPDGRSYEVDGEYWQQQTSKDYMIRVIVKQ